MLNGYPLNAHSVNTGGYVRGAAVDAGLAFIAEGKGHVRVPGGASVGMVFGSTAQGYRRFRGAGISHMVLDSAGEAYRRFRGAASAKVDIDSDGEAQQIEPAKADIALAITTQSQAYTAGHVDLEGNQAGIRFTSMGSIRRAVTRKPLAQSRIEMYATGVASTTHHADTDEAAIVMAASGHARVPGFVHGSGGSHTSISVSPATASLWRHVTSGSEEALITIEASSNSPGKPVIGPFEPAPGRRRVVVPAEQRTIIVTRSRRAA